MTGKHIALLVVLVACTASMAVASRGIQRDVLDQDLARLDRMWATRHGPRADRGDKSASGDEAFLQDTAEWGNTQETVYGRAVRLEKEAARAGKRKWYAPWLKYPEVATPKPRVSRSSYTPPERKAHVPSLKGFQPTARQIERIRGNPDGTTAWDGKKWTNKEVLAHISTLAPITKDGDICKYIKHHEESSETIMQVITEAVTGGTKDGRERVGAVFRCIAPYTKGRDYPHYSVLRGNAKMVCLKVQDIIKNLARTYILTLPTSAQKKLVGDHSSALRAYDTWVKKYLGNRSAGGKFPWEEDLGQIGSACSRVGKYPGIDFNVPALDYAAHAVIVEAGIQKSGVCRQVREASGDKLLTVLKNAISQRDAKTVEHTFRCLVPWTPYKYGEAWGQTDVVTAKKPQEQARCDVYYRLLFALAQPRMLMPIAQTSDPTFQFGMLLDKAGIKIHPSVLHDINSACDDDRPYRDFGTTNQDTTGSLSFIRVSMAQNIPRDTANSAALRLGLFCLHGIRKIHRGSEYIRPGESLTYRVGYNKWGKSEGLSCTLNQGLSNVRRYKIGNRKYSCVFSAFWWKKWGDKAGFSIPDPIDCPYRWVVQPDSTATRPHIRVEMVRVGSSQSTGTDEALPTPFRP